MNTKQMQALIFDMQTQKEKVEIHRLNNVYVYASTYKTWVSEYNALLQRYNAIAELSLSKMIYGLSDLSSTQKTAQETSIKSYINTIDRLIQKIKDDIDTEHKASNESIIPFYQIRRCFKLGIEKCPRNPNLNKMKVFIAMPFEEKYSDSYEFGLKLALGQLGYDHYKADNEVSNKDIMCKICYELQSCSLVIVNISGLNPNVMLEHGLAYGMGKSVIIIKDKETKSISDLGSLEYIEYSHAHDLQTKLYVALKK